MIAPVLSQMIDYLKTQPDMAAAVSGRVYAGIIPQGQNAEQGTLVVDLLTAPAPHDLTGSKIALVESRWQFDAYAPTLTLAETIANAVDLALVDNFTGLSTVTLQKRWRSDGPDDLSAQSGDETTRRLSLSYTIFYEES